MTEKEGSCLLKFHVNMCGRGANYNEMSNKKSNEKF
jgi:hypothetical protein